MALDYLVMLVLGLVVAVSPIPLLALALILVTPRRRANGLAFLVGWIGALALVCIVASFFAGALEAVLGVDLPAWTLIVKLGIGVGFLLMAFKSWKDARSKDSADRLPALASGLDSIGPGRSLALAGFLGVVGVKNPLVCLAAAFFISASGLGQTARLLGWLLFLAAAGILYAIPVFYAILGGREGCGAAESGARVDREPRIHLDGRHILRHGHHLRR